MTITTIGLDLAKNVFQVHGVDGRGMTALRKQLRRDQVAAYFARLQPCLVGIEACGGAHYWAAKLTALGHNVKMMAPQFVKPYVKTNKNDDHDAEAVCEAVGRGNMRFVPVKTLEQQDIQAIHRVREQLIKSRTAQANQIRGLLGEYGIVLAKGVSQLRARLPEILEDAENGLTHRIRRPVGRPLRTGPGTRCAHPSLRQGDPRAVPGGRAQPAHRKSRRDRTARGHRDCGGGREWKRLQGRSPTFRLVGFGAAATCHRRAGAPAGDQ